MKLIDTSPISPGVGYPGLAHNTSILVGLDFWQQATKDMANALALALLIAPADLTKATILSGCVVTYGTSFTTITAGWVYFGGEIFEVQSQSIPTTYGLDINANWIPNPTDATAQTVFSDGSLYSVHNTRTVQFSYGSTIGNIPNIMNNVTGPGPSLWLTTRMAADELVIYSNTTEIGTLITDVAAINATLLSLSSTVSALNEPVGTIKMYGGNLSFFDMTGLGSGVWTNWALCNGNHGTPDLSGRFVVGYDTTGIDGSAYNTIGNTGGESAHLLSDTESGLPAHGHGLTDPGHNHGVNDPGHTHPVQAQNSNNSGGGNFGEANGTNIPLSTESATTGIYLDSAFTGISVNNAGPNTAASAHENRPRYYTLAYVMKIV